MKHILFEIVASPEVDAAIGAAAIGGAVLALLTGHTLVVVLLFAFAIVR
jgi:hypothetical protein